MSAKVLMYCTAVCPYCIRAEQLLNRKGVVSIEKVRVDLEPARREEMVTRSGRRSVPQVYIGDTHVGGFDDLAGGDFLALGQIDGAGGNEKFRALAFGFRFQIRNAFDRHRRAHEQRLGQIRLQRNFVFGEGNGSGE